MSTSRFDLACGCVEGSEWDPRAVGFPSRIVLGRLAASASFSPPSLFAGFPREVRRRRHPRRVHPDGTVWSPSVRSTLRIRVVAVVSFLRLPFLSAVGIGWSRSVVLVPSSDRSRSIHGCASHSFCVGRGRWRYLRPSAVTSGSVVGWSCVWVGRLRRLHSGVGFTILTCVACPSFTCAFLALTTSPCFLMFPSNLRISSAKFPSGSMPTTVRVKQKGMDARNTIGTGWGSLLKS